MANLPAWPRAYAALNSQATSTSKLFDLTLQLGKPAWLPATTVSRYSAGQTGTPTSSPAWVRCGLSSAATAPPCNADAQPRAVELDGRAILGADPVGGYTFPIGGNRLESAWTPSLALRWASPHAFPLAAAKCWQTAREQPPAAPPVHMLGTRTRRPLGSASGRSPGFIAPAERFGFTRQRTAAVKRIAPPGARLARLQFRQHSWLAFRQEAS